MVFHFRCFSCSFEDGEKIEYETRTQTKSTWTETFHTAFSNFNSFIPNFHAKTSEFSSLAEKPSNLRVFTLAELNAATNDFSKDLKIGEGGFGKVYSGVIKSLEHPFGKTQVAVKYAKGVLTSEFSSLAEKPSNLRVFTLAELNAATNDFSKDLKIGEGGFGKVYSGVIKSLEHPFGETQVAVKYAKGVLRLKVAQDAARGLAYLHEEIDLKFTGTIGYAAPEYISAGHLSYKSDVWSYGIFLYELITGRHPLDKNGPRHEELLEWVNPQLNPKKFITIIDSRLGGKYSFKSVQGLSIIANSCLSNDRKSRPKMSEVLEMINQLIGVPTTATMPMKVSAEISK
ncbi:protein kinase-like domain-containing protein [Artemisia annua]|uniref:Protein kinase-like domain-containing protein n=1 Tax=Artemisia annua TaxID=35608 RepID=A0A2U1N719_ARTAN|nr:protein kinase-like domain-containing protein [Artemisia annua]